METPSDGRITVPPPGVEEAKLPTPAQTDMAVTTTAPAIPAQAPLRESDSAQDEVERQKNSPIDTASRLGGLLLATIYGTGFLIVAIHHSQYGISDFGLLRARILSAGLLFIVLLSVPILTVSRVFRLFGLGKSLGIGISVPPEHQSELNIFLSINIYIAAFSFSLMLQFLFSNLTKPKDWMGTLLIVAVTLYIAVGLAAKRSFSARPAKFIIAIFLVATSQFLIALLYLDRHVFWLSMWFYFVAAGTPYFYRRWAEPGNRSKTEWEWFALTSGTAVLFVFATRIYGGISPYYGGGAPLPATVHFSGRDPMVTSDGTPVFLIEETDQGYYLVRALDGKHSYFLRRDTVSGVEFGEGERGNDSAEPPRERSARPFLP